MKKPIDLTHAFDQGTLYWPTEDGFSHEKEYFGQTDKGFFYSSYRFSSAEHGGTHIDAPIHFSEFGETLDQIPLSRLMGPGALIDITDHCLNNPDYLVTVEDLVAWERKTGMSLEEKIVLLRTGFGRFWPDPIAYLGTKEKGESALKNLHFPGLDPAAASWLVIKRRIKAIGIDTASIDYGQSVNFNAHRNLLQANVPAFENVANLDQLPNFGFDIIALPMKIKNGSGGPLRIVALIP